VDVGPVLKRYLPGVLVFCLAAALYLATLPRGVLPGDSGELIAASRTLSIAHPPGYPLYTMVGRMISSVLASGSMAYRYNMISALLISLTLAVVYLILVNLGVRRMLAVAVSLGLGTLGSFWLQATTAEVYALNALFTALLLHVALVSRRYGQRGFLMLGMIGGLSLSHHLTLVYPLVCALGIMVIGHRLRPTIRTTGLSVLLLVLGLSVWLYIPVRARLHPPLVWGRTDTLSGFLAHITAQGYRWRLREFDLLGRGADFVAYLRVLGREAGVIITLAAILGAVIGRTRLALRLLLAAMVIFFGFHFAMYNIPDIESHIFPALVGMGLLAGLGLERVVGVVARRGKIVGRVAVAACFVMLLPNLLSIRPRADEWFAEDYASAIEQSARDACGEGCIVITSGHLSTFPLLYASLVEPGGVLVFDIVASDPSIIGEQNRTANIEECVSRAAEKFGSEKIAMLGPVPRLVLGKEPRICGMVYVVEEPHGRCLSPEDYTVRGVGKDLREYSSRLLSGSYYLHLATWSGQVGDTMGVRTYIGKALAAARDDEATYINGAQLYLRYGMLDEAFDAAETAIAINPEFFGGHDLLGGMLARVQRTDQAIAEYRKALKGNPSPAGAYSNLANAYLSRGDLRAAMENFNKAIELDSTLVNAYVGLGLAEEGMGDSEGALAMFRRARSIDPYSEPAYHAEASLLIRMGRDNDASDLARQALREWPGSALIQSDLGLVYLRSDALDSAIVYLREAVERDPSLLNARGNLAVALERKGLIEPAIEQYRIYLETAPPGRSRDIAAGALGRLTGTLP
jgi:tetratricopeptide (TPR) repeat protein